MSIETINRYQNFCKTNELPIFKQYWWLDSICGKDNWTVILIEDNNEVIASLTYYKAKSYFFNVIKPPFLTERSGLHIIKDKGILSENKILDRVLDQLPKVAYTEFSFSYGFTNWLPLYWRGYLQTTKYSYVLNDLTDIEAIVSKFSRAKKKNIRRAETILNVKYDLSAFDFYENHKMSLRKQGQTITYDFLQFDRIYKEVYKRNQGRVIYAIDSEGNIHAGLFVVWDVNSAYNLISTIDPEYRNSGANSLLIKEIIKYVSDKTNSFDFSGSMIKGVENSIKQFGGERKSYMVISKYNSLVYCLMKNLNRRVKLRVK